MVLCVGKQMKINYVGGEALNNLIPSVGIRSGLDIEAGFIGGRFHEAPLDTLWIRVIDVIN